MAFMSVGGGDAADAEKFFHVHAAPGFGPRLSGSLPDQVQFAGAFDWPSTVRTSSEGRHRVFVFEKMAYRAQKSTSDINGLDPRIHRYTVKGVMSGLRNSFVTVPEMLANYRAVKARAPLLKQNAGSKSLFEASAFNDLKIAALAYFESLRQKRAK
jgi:hypothetical protein